MNRDLQDRIDDYILNRMSAEERAAFEKELSQSEAMQQQFNFTKNLKSAITSRESKLSAVNTMRQQRDKQSTMTSLPLRSTRRTRHIVAWASAIAAVLVVGLFVVTPLLVENTDFVDNGGDVMRGQGDDLFEMVPEVDIETTIEEDSLPERDSLIVENPDTAE